MSEMIGVLAFIGMLSVVSVYVFQKAMIKNRTNQLVEDMRLAGMVVLDGLYDKLTENEISIKGQFEQQTPYTFTAALEEASRDTFVVIADGVPFDVCVAVKDRKPNWAETVAVNGIEETCHETENNFVSFFFNNELTDMLHDYCQGNSDCGECGTCKDNKCSYGFKDQSGKCYSCNHNNKSIYGVDQEECHKCKNRMWSSLTGGRCIARLTKEIGSWADVSKEECERFPNQYLTSYTHCFYCEGSIDPITGICSTADCDTTSSVIYGLDEATCLQQCGGTSFYMTGVDGGGKISVCLLK